MENYEKQKQLAGTFIQQVLDNEGEEPIVQAFDVPLDRVIIDDTTGLQYVVTPLNDVKNYLSILSYMPEDDDELFHNRRELKAAIMVSLLLEIFDIRFLEEIPDNVVEFNPIKDEVIH